MAVNRRYMEYAKEMKDIRALRKNVSIKEGAADEK